MTIGILGLGRMGAQIARRLHTKGFDVVAWNRGPEPREEFKKFGGKVATTPEELINQLATEPRIIWLMLPSGDLLDEMIKRLALSLSRGDVIIDGGNSFYKDSQRRAEELKKRGIHFFDSGTSGGVHGEKNGFSLMVGGPKEVFAQAAPIFEAISAKPEVSPLVGPAGAGHFVKMVHNAIEYGMMEAIAEGFAVLKAGEYQLDFSQVAGLWSRGSVVSSWLIDLAKNIFETENLDEVVGIIDHTGEGEWTIKEAKRLGVDVRVIEDAFRVRQESLDPKNHEKFSNKIVALLRNQFGAHAVHRKNNQN